MIRSTLTTLVAEILDLDEADITDESGPDNLESWDSLNMLRIVSAVEEELKIQFSMDEIEAIDSFGALHSIAQAHLQ